MNTQIEYFLLASAPLGNGTTGDIVQSVVVTYEQQKAETVRTFAMTPLRTYLTFSLLALNIFHQVIYIQFIIRKKFY